MFREHYNSHSSFWDRELAKFTYRYKNLHKSIFLSILSNIFIKYYREYFILGTLHIPFLNCFLCEFCVFLHLQISHKRIKIRNLHIVSQCISTTNYSINFINLNLPLPLTPPHKRSRISHHGDLSCI